MKFFKRNPFGHVLLIKKWLIRILGVLSHQRFKGFNQLKIEGSDIIRSLPESNVLFVSNHQTYFADVVAMFHVFNASLSGRDDSIKNLMYLWEPKLLGHLSKSFSGIHNITKLNDKINFRVHDILPIKNDLKIRLVK